MRSFQSANRQATKNVTRAFGSALTLADLNWRDAVGIAGADRQPAVEDRFRSADEDDRRQRRGVKGPCRGSRELLAEARDGWRLHDREVGLARHAGFADASMGK